MKKILCSAFLLLTLTAFSQKTYQEYYNLGHAKLDFNQDYKGAIQDLNKAIELKSDYFEAFRDRGICKSELKDYKGALEDLDKAIELNTNDYTAIVSRANTKLKTKDYPGALEDYNKALELKPGSYKMAETLNNKALAKFESGDKTGACEDWNKAGKAGNADAYANIKKHCK